MVMSLVGAMCCNGKQCVEYSLSLGMAPSGITVPNMAADTGGLRRQLAAVTDDQRKRSAESGMSRDAFSSTWGR